MPQSSPPWMRHLVYRTECTRTTWKLRVGLVLALVLGVWLSRGWWAVKIAESLVCEANAAPSDAILVENFDPDYLVFEKARILREQGLASRVLVPVAKDRDTEEPNDVAVEFAAVLARVSRLGSIEMVPTRQTEPISLTAARDVRSYLERERIRSVVVVSPFFRSRRSDLVYRTTLAQAGVTVTCSPSRGTRGVSNWADSWHGIQGVVEQWGKLQYYRLYVLPFSFRPER